MLVLSGYNFTEDINAIDPFPTNVNNINNIKIQNGIFDYFNMTNDVTSAYSTDKPTAWDYLTLMNCNFDGTINAGNVAFNLSSVDGFKIKRRKTTDFNWVTLGFLSVSSTEQTTFTFQDNLAASLQEYEYAFVPVISGVESDYITSTITTNFSGVFICDLDTIYRFYAGVSYGDADQVQKVGVYEPFGKKYPVVVSNAITNYHKGSVSGTILNSDFITTNNIDRLAIVQERKDLIDFLTNKKAKILKDWNGAEWLCCVVGTPSTAYVNNYGMGIANVGFDYVEVGDSNTQSDLYNSGIVSVES
jgi:hypothetical protein